MVPTMVSLLLADPGFDAVDWSSLRYTVIGAAPVPMEVAREFERRTGARVLQGYGLTETSPAVSLMRLEDPTNGSAGMPVPNVEVQIRDDQGRALGPNETGEIVVRGPNVMAGYYKMPDATAEVIDDGWFHTGDMGHLDEDGYLYITDRKKDLIIRGGFNIYPSDVEDVLHRHPAVLECGVVGVPDQTMGEEVKAYVVLRSGARAGEEELLAHCREHLAKYKSPRWITITDQLPKTPVGKILRRDLRERAAKEAAG
jgi:long-chain acyl-CoA synthetase